MQKFRDPQNNIEEIVHRLANIASGFGDKGKKFEVKHQVVDFQKVTLGEKIRNIYEFVLEREGADLNNLDMESMTRCSFDKFDYIFDDLILAQMMDVGEENKDFYELGTC